MPSLGFLFFLEAYNLTQTFLCGTLWWGDIFSETPFMFYISVMKASIWELFRTNLWELNFLRTKILQELILELILDF